MKEDRNTRQFRVWRNANGKMGWAVLSDKASRQFPVIWSPNMEDATLFSNGEAQTIKTRYPVGCGVESVEVNEGKSDAA